MSRVGIAAVRALDVLTALTGLLLSWPLLVGLLILSALETRSFPLYRSAREGLDGRRFTHVKIRTFPRRAPVAPSYLAGAAAGRACAFMRLSHLDELPELVLVLLGSMSMVGPRPLVSAIRKSYESRPGPLRPTVRPGWTGPAQLELALLGAISSARQFELDEAWCAHPSPGAWVACLTATVRLIFRLALGDRGKRNRNGELPGGGRYRAFASGLFLGKGRSKSS